MDRRIARNAWLGVVVLAALTSACGNGGITGIKPASQPVNSRYKLRAQLNAADGAANDYLGGALWYNSFEQPVRPVYYATPGEAAMSSNGTVALVGAAGHAVRGLAGAGTAYVFVKHPTTWAEIARLSSADTASYDAFGWSVTLSGDGRTAIIGAPFHGQAPRPHEGAAYVFEEAGGRWRQTAQLVPTDGRAYDNFGWSVAISRDGTTALVGAPSHAPHGTERVGAAYVFRRSGSTWVAAQGLATNGGTQGDDVGAYVALSGNGSTALVTKLGHVDEKKVRHDGGSLIFTTTDQWHSIAGTATLANPNRNADGTGDEYGVDAKLSDDGSVAAVAAPDVNVGDNGYGAGAAYVYTTTSGWRNPAQNSTTTLLELAPRRNAYYGSSVALSADGLILAVGVDGDGTNDQGSIYVVRPAVGGGADPWKDRVTTQTLVPAPHNAQGRFGTAVATGSDGTVLLGTSPWLKVGVKQFQGAAFVLALSAG